MDYETNKIISQEELNKMGEELSNYAESLINQQFKKISNDMDYEKKYKRLYNFISDLYPFMSEYCKEKVEGFLPELCESEDEKIRKGLINGFNECLKNSQYSNNAQKYWHNIKIEDIFAWLEKQGGQTDKIVERAKTERQRVLITESNGEANIDWDTRRLQDAKLLLEYGLDYVNKLEKQRKQKPILDFNADDWYVSKVDGKIHNIYHSVDKVEPKFKVGDWVVSPNGVYWHIDAIQNGRYEVTADTGQCGNWPLDTNIYRLWTIQDAKDGDVLINKSNGRECPFIFKETKPSNIKTDVLNPLSVLGYCGIGGAGFTKGSGWGDTANCIYYPATKEQRDLLFRKMQEAGYTFDFEKKELKEIEDEEYNGEDYGIDSLYHAISILEKTLGKVQGYQSDDGILSHKCAITAVKKLYKKKPAEWSEEDERMYRRLHNLIYATPYCDSRKELSDYLESLKDRVQPKQEWSKEDEKCIRLSMDIIDSALRAGFCVQLDRDRCIDLLKSIKQRIGG